jgi:hypothetical protein
VSDRDRVYRSPKRASGESLTRFIRDEPQAPSVPILNRVQPSLASSDFSATQLIANIAGSPAIANWGFVSPDSSGWPEFQPEKEKSHSDVARRAILRGFVTLRLPGTR